MAVDILRKYRALDENNLSKEKEKISGLISNRLYPNRFTFPMVLQFELTSNCNVYCKHCYNDSGQKKTCDAMTPGKWIEFANYLVENGGLFECIISGGEPLLLGDQLFDIMDILDEDGTTFLLITNGYLLEKDRIKKLSKYKYRWLQVSIDGSDKDYHDSFRQKNGSWERAVNGAFMVSAAGIPLTIAHSVSPFNIEKIDEMCALAYDLGASSIIIGEINLSGRTAQNRELLLNDNQKRYLLYKYEENFAKYSGRMLVQRSASTKNSIMRYADTPNLGLIVRPNGDLRLDCMAPFVIGNILQNDFTDIWFNKGINCWENKKVRDFLNSFSDMDTNVMVTNYVDDDIYI